MKLILVEETFALPSNQLGRTNSSDSMLKVLVFYNVKGIIWTFMAQAVFSQFLFSALYRAVKIMILTVDQRILAEMKKA